MSITVISESNVHLMQY